MSARALWDEGHPTTSDGDSIVTTTGCGVRNRTTTTPEVIPLPAISSSLDRTLPRKVLLTRTNQTPPDTGIGTTRGRSEASLYSRA